MKKFSELVMEVVLTPEQKKRREVLKAKHRKYTAKGLDTSEIEAELATLGGYTPKGAKQTTTNKVSDDPDFSKGFEAAIKAMQDAQNGKSKPGGGSGVGEGGLPIPDDLFSKGQENNSGGGDSGEGKENGQGQQGGGKSRDSKEGGNQGVVRPEDCIGPNQLKGTPGQAGGMLSKELGDAIAESEGYEKSGGSSSNVEKEWKERANSVAKQAGKGASWDVFKAKLQGLWNKTVDWKNELKKIVGHAINPADKRQAYANKNVLVSQDRIARTDKDKYDNMDYMQAWIDTSGSMTNEFLNDCISEVYKLALAKKPMRLDIWQFDTRVADQQTFSNLPSLKKGLGAFQMKGGGGTDVKCCFNEIQNNKKYSKRKCELVVIFTDGYLTQYKRPMKNIGTLVWVVIDNPGFELQYKDTNTKLIRISSADIK